VPVAALNVPLGDMAEAAYRLVGEGKTVIVAVDGHAAGVIAAADVVRPNAARLARTRFSCG
jgi:cation transport ATPase